MDYCDHKYRDGHTVVFSLVMGLDMYLEKRTYVKNWDHMKPEQKHKVTIEGPESEHIKPERISYIIEQVAYWRKANQINEWFIQNCADGVDDNGGKHYVSLEQLRELVDLCKRVLKASKLVKGKIVNGYTYENGTKVPHLEDGKTIKDPTLAQELLPTQSGFFFGSTEYDQYYIEDLKETVRQLEPLLEEGDSGSYYYSNSW